MELVEQPKFEIDIFYSDEDEAYIANVPELRYCSAHGDTYEEALHEALVAVGLHVEVLGQEGRPVPEPQMASI